MYRSILCGLVSLTLVTGAFRIAQADEVTVPAVTVAAANVQTTTTASSTLTSAAQIHTENPDGDDAVAPTAGADLAMWNASPTAVDDKASAPVKSISRLRRFASGIVSRSSAIASSLTRSAMRFIGTPYVFGGTRSTGFDCSGYVQHVFGLLGVRLPRTADAQFGAGHRLISAMAPGDLVFFHTYAPGVSHVGIYLGNSKFIHSSSSHGVSVSSLHDSYWAPRYLGAKRVFGS